MRAERKRPIDLSDPKVMENIQRSMRTIVTSADELIGRKGEITLRRTIRLMRQHYPRLLNLPDTRVS